MSLFDSLGSKPQQAAQMTPQDAFTQLRNDPVGTLRKAGLNVPDGMNDAQQIVQHLLQSGQLPQGRLQQAMQMAGQMMGRR